MPTYRRGRRETRLGENPCILGDRAPVERRENAHLVVAGNVNKSQHTGGGALGGR